MNGETLWLHGSGVSNIHHQFCFMDDGSYLKEKEALPDRKGLS